MDVLPMDTICSIEYCGEFAFCMPIQMGYFCFKQAIAPHDWTKWVCAIHIGKHTLIIAELSMIHNRSHTSFLRNPSAMLDSIAHVFQQLPSAIMFYHKRFRSPFAHIQVLQTVCDLLGIADGCRKSDVCFSFGIPHISWKNYDWDCILHWARFTPSSRVR